MTRRKQKRLSLLSKELESDTQAKLLTTHYTNSEETTPNEMNGMIFSRDAGTLVWAKFQGARQLYWPAFIAHLEDKPGLTEEELKDDIMTGANSAMVIFIEEKFRIAALPWDRMIPVCEEHFEAQLKALIKLSTVECKKSPIGNALFKKSMDYLQEFRSLEKTERRAKGQTIFLSQQKDKKQQSLTDGSKTSQQQKSLTRRTTVTVVKQEERTRKQGRYSLRTPPPITRSPSPKESTGRSDSLGTNTKNSDNNALINTTVEVTEKAKKEGSRPKEGGRALKEWAANRFHPIDKSFRFESQKIIVCAADGCGQEINNGESPVFCHDFPFHARCVKQVTVGAEGKTRYFCADCLDKRCFICKSNTDKDCLKCSKCDLFYHVNCLHHFPQAEIQGPTGPITCPLHYCHTCIAEHSILKKVRNYKVGKGNALRCIKCPTSYHRVCLPAPSLSTVMSNNFIICPKHQDFETGNKGRRLGCFMCNKKVGSKGLQSIVNCSKCPLSYHMKCVVDESTFETPEEREKYRSTFECEGCFWGLFPVPGQAIWCRQAGYKFWPARILYPKEASQRTVLSPHSFSVSYFGNQQSYFDGARCVRTVTLSVAGYDVLQKIKLFPDEHKMTTAYEEGRFVMSLSEDHRAAILNEPEPIYKKTEKNVYKIPSRKSKGGNRKERDSDGEYDSKSLCPCHEEKNAEEICGVGSGCINRDQAMECTPITCGDDARCSNRMFSRKTTDKIEAFATNNKGWGVRTLELFKKGEFVVEYVGEVISKELYQWRLTRKFSIDPHYFLELDTNSFIDAEYVGNLSRLINHSCEPNCSTEKYMSLGKPVVGVFAKYDIPPGTELTFDYAYEMTGNSAKTFNCCCGSTNCRGQVNNKNTRNNQIADLSPSQLRRDEEWKEYCEICLYSGEYLLCCEAPEGCDKAYHADCLGLSSVPKGTWICPDPGHQPTGLAKKATRKRKSIGTKVESTTMNNDQENKRRRRSKVDKDVRIVEVVAEHRDIKAPLVPQESN